MPTSGTMRAWRVHALGDPLEVLRLDQVPALEPSDQHVVLEVLASAVNFADTLLCRGTYQEKPELPFTPGLEVCGRVLAAPPGAAVGPGERVIALPALPHGGLAEQAVARPTDVFSVPDTMDDVTAAALPVTYQTGWFGLYHRARLQEGETVLVHAAAGGVGSAAVQLAIAAGARVIATAGGEEKLAFAKGLGADVAIDYREVDFAQVVLDETGGAGVDVCFDGVGGDVMMQSLRCLGRGGRHLMVGFASGIEAEEVPMVSGRALCFGNFDIVGVILAYRDRSIPASLQFEMPVPVPRFNSPPADQGEAVQAHLLELLDAGVIRPVVGDRVAFEQLPEALEAMEARQMFGRVVVER